MAVISRIPAIAGVLGEVPIFAPLTTSELEELASRGYDKRPDPRAARAAREVDESLAMVATVLPPAQPADAGASAPAADSLASTLERRRREASWRLN